MKKSLSSKREKKSPGSDQDGPRKRTKALRAAAAAVAEERQENSQLEAEEERDEGRSDEDSIPSGEEEDMGYDQLGQQFAAEEGFPLNEEDFNHHDPSGLGLAGVDKYSTYEEYLDQHRRRESDVADLRAQLLELRSERDALQDRSTLPSGTTVLANVPVVSLKGLNMGYHECKKFRDFIDGEVLARRQPNRNALIDPPARFLITHAFKGKSLLKDGEEWLNWPDGLFFDNLLQVFPKKSAANSATSMEDLLRPLRLKVDFRDAVSLNTYVSEIFEALKYKLPETTSEVVAVKLLLTGLTSRVGKGDIYPPSKVNIRLKERILHGGEPTTVDEYATRLYAQYYFLAEAVAEVSQLGLLSYKDNNKPTDEDTTTDRRPGQRTQQQQQQQQQQRVADNADRTSSRKSCNACGKENTHHTWSTCVLRAHPNHNPLENILWKDSPMGKAWAEKGKQQLPWKYLLNGHVWADAPAVPQAKNRRARGELNVLAEQSILIDCYIVLKNTQLTVSTLFDSGSTQNNLISRDVAQLISAQENDCVVCDRDSSAQRRLALGRRNTYMSIDGVVSFKFRYFNELNKCWETIDCIKALVGDITHDIIIGLPTIRTHNITAKIPSFFTEISNNIESVPAIVPTCDCSKLDPDNVKVCTPCTDTLPVAAIQASSAVQPTPFVRAQLNVLHNLSSDTKTRKSVRFPKEKYLQYTDDPDDTEQIDEVFPFIDGNDMLNEKELLKQIHIAGPPTLQSQIRDLVTEYSDIHAEAVRPEPANIPPMELKINMDKWNKPENRLPPRTQSKIKEDELGEQVKKLKELKVLQPSTASEYSQVLLVPKPDVVSHSNPDIKQKKWRFCVDYVRLNDATESMEAFPIPNMQHMLRRVGDKRPKYFAVMDLTSGYHQAPLSVNSRKFTAFICFLGILEWLRVPMGLKGAPSYFQRVLATIVLSGLMYVICELYIDDVLVFGNTEQEFIANLRKVFERFRKHNLTLNPKKCKYGISQVEYVGHVIDERGVTFSDEKRKKVLDFPLPTHMKQLKKFLGLANYFRDHVKNHSDKARPLQRMIDSYDRHVRLKWTPELEQVYYQLRDEIAKCPSLFFLDPQGEIVVQTDASDYGIGAYIFQLVGGVEQPVLFISKTLNTTQCNWSTPEKEAYAIFYALTHAEHLLRDVHFLLQTDHRNLTFINMEGSPKIRRWKLAIQEYDFDIEYLPGEKNVVADNFSRLCDIEDPDITLCTYSEMRIPSDKYRTISKVHNTQVGHWGVERTIQRLYDNGQRWTHLREHVRMFVRQCPCCQLMSQIKIPIKTHPFTRASYEPMQCVNIDTIGPLPKDDFGNEHILVIIDCFTRFVELYPIADTSAKAAARAILQHVGRYGVSSKYLTDNGSQYANELLAELKTLLRTEHEFTVPYSKEENAIVERVNKEVMRHLRAIIFDSRIINTWSHDYLPLVMRILNTAEKETTGVSPAELLFGNVIQMDRIILHPPPKEDESSTPMQLSEHMASMLKAQADLIKVAQEHQHTHDEFHMSLYNSEYTEYPVNSYVLLAYPDGDRPPNKLKTNLRGPFRVVNLNGSKYTIQNLLTSKNFDVHISRLRPFLYDAERTDPKDVAMHEQEEFIIEKILQHRGDTTRRKQIEFLVKWQDFDNSQNSWEPYSNLRDTEQLLEYLRANKLKSLINKKHRQ